jgi:hypothetical protein
MDSIGADGDGGLDEQVDIEEWVYGAGIDASDVDGLVGLLDVQ